MPIYEYVARDCDNPNCILFIRCPIDQAANHPEKELADGGTVRCPHGHIFRRVFESRAVTTHYHVIHAADTHNEREFTSRNDYKRHLHELSQETTDRTGIVHDFQPVDMNDPAIAPADDW